MMCEWYLFGKHEYMYKFVIVECWFHLIGHTRYSTQGDSDTINVQPFVVETIHGLIAVAHNGELVNAKKLKQKVC